MAVRLKISTLLQGVRLKTASRAKAILQQVQAQITALAYKFLKPLLHAVRLQLLAALRFWHQQHEDRKAVLYKNRKIAALSFAIHFLPLAGAIILLAFNLKSFYIGNVTTTTLTVLQLPAKGLEIMIQASLAVMILHLITRSAIGEKPMPLGMLFAPYQVGDISYLWSLQYWACLTSKDFHIRYKLITFVVIPATLGLALVVGPASAIAMIPRVIDYSQGTTLFLMPPQNDLFPLQVNLTGGLVEMEDIVSASLYQLGAMNLVGTMERTITDDRGFRTLYWTEDGFWEGWYQQTFVNPGEDGRYASYIMSTLPGQPLSQIFNAEQNIQDVSADGELVASHFQPYVEQRCATKRVSANQIFQDNFTDSIWFGDDAGHINNLLTAQDLMSIWQKSPNTSSNGLNCQGVSESGLSYTGLISINEASKALLDLIFFSPSQAGSYDSFWMVYGELLFGPQDFWTMTACRVDAFWYLTHSNHSVLTAVTTSKPPEDLRFRQGARIDVDRDWASRVSEIFYNSTGTNLNTMLARGAAAFAIALSNAGSNYLPGTLPTVYPDRISGDYPTAEDLWSTTPQQTQELLQFVHDRRFLSHYVEVDNYAFNNWTDPAQLSQVQVARFRLGYGYNASDTTVQLALAVLAFYCLLVAAFTIYTVVTGMTATSWDTIGEITLLALNSERPSHLSGTSVGVETLSTYRKPVSIRVNTQKDSVGVIFDDDTAIVKANYSTVDPGAEYW